MRVNEIFYSIQGEGYHAGTPAVFVRLSGCNLRCPFCDTEHQEHTEMSEDEIAEAVSKYPASLVVITGGEPTIQPLYWLIDAIHRIGKKVAIETNGTQPVERNADWITVSPKDGFVGESAKPVLTYADEIKLVFDGGHIPDDHGIHANHFYLQPCDTGYELKNQEIMQELVEFVKQNPKWKISLQTQKILKVR